MKHLNKPKLIGYLSYIILAIIIIFSMLINFGVSTYHKDDEDKHFSQSERPWIRRQPKVLRYKTWITPYKHMNPPVQEIIGKKTYKAIYVRHVIELKHKKGIEYYERDYDKNRDDLVDTRLNKNDTSKKTYYRKITPHKYEIISGGKNLKADLNSKGHPSSDDTILIAKVKKHHRIHFTILIEGLKKPFGTFKKDYPAKRIKRAPVLYNHKIHFR